MGLSENTVPFSGWSWFPLLKWAFGRSTPFSKMPNISKHVILLVWIHMHSLFIPWRCWSWTISRRSFWSSMWCTGGELKDFLPWKLGPVPERSRHESFQGSFLHGCLLIENRASYGWPVGGFELLFSSLCHGPIMLTEQMQFLKAEGRMLASMSEAPHLYVFTYYR